MSSDAPAALRDKFASIWPMLDERARRLVAANEAVALGYGGVSAVHRACGLSRVTIAAGIEEIINGVQLEQGRVRRAGAGRKPVSVSDPSILPALDRLIEPDTRGDPESPLRWVCKSTRTLATMLAREHHRISHVTLAELLHAQGYSLQSNRKTEEGGDHPDRDAQFRYINAAVTRALAAQIPVISVDTKKKELIGNYANVGRQWRRTRQPETVNGHDFPSPDVPRAFPYGIYDIGRNEGFVNVGTDHDTGAFAVASIRGWWRAEGRLLYPRTKALVITADAGGSNGWRLRLWKWELQRFADDTSLALSVCHFPPGTSKWNKVEHRLFSFISSNWRGEPLREYETIVNLIARTTTAQGLKVSCRLDRRRYRKGRRISDDEMGTLNIKSHRFHGEWNYTVRPRCDRSKNS